MIKTTIPRRGSEVLLVNHKGLRLLLPCRKPRDSAYPCALNENTNQNCILQSSSSLKARVDIHLGLKVLARDIWAGVSYQYKCLPFALVALSKVSAERKVRKFQSEQAVGQKGRRDCGWTC